MSKAPTRMEQLGNLLTAMIAIIVSGSTDLLIVPPEPIDPIFKTPPFGIYSRVARELSVSACAVRKVALGQWKSERIAAALLAEAARCKPGKSSDLYGMYSKVAHELGVTPQHVSHVDKGLHKSQRVSTAISLELQRIAAQKGGKA